MNSCHERIFYYFTTTTHIEIRDAIEIVLRLWCDLHVLYSFHFLCFNIINIKKKRYIIWDNFNAKNYVDFIKHINSSKCSCFKHSV